MIQRVGEEKVKMAKEKLDFLISEYLAAVEIIELSRNLYLKDLEKRQNKLKKCQN